MTDHETIRHPLVDAVHAGWVQSESRSAVIYLSEGRADLFVQAASGDVRVVLVTDELSSLTEAYYQAMRDYRGAWVVRGQGGTLRDGITGAKLAAIDDVLASPAIRDIDDVAVDYLRPKPTDQLEILLNASVRHRADADAVLGGFAEQATTTLQGVAPMGWGVTEPATVGWDRAELTAFARRRMPADTQFALAGTRTHPLTGTLGVRRTDRGLEEISQLFLGVGAAGSDSATAAPERVLGLLAAGEEKTMPLIALALARPGVSSQLRSPVLQAPANPLALLIGAPGVRALGLDPARMVAEFGAIAVGRPRIPALLFPLGTLDDLGWPRVEAVLGAVDAERLGALLGSGTTILDGLNARHRMDTGLNDTGTSESGGKHGA